MAKAYSTTAMQKVRDDKAIDVMLKFVDAAYAEASIQIASDKLAESKRLLAQMQRLYELGEKGRPDVVQMESQVAEDEYNLTHQKNVAQQSLLSLKSAMNFPVEEELHLMTEEGKMVVENSKQVNWYGKQLNGGKNDDNYYLLDNQGNNRNGGWDSPINHISVYQNFLKTSPDVKWEIGLLDVELGQSISPHPLSTACG